MDPADDPAPPDPAELDYFAAVAAYESARTPPWWTRLSRRGLGPLLLLGLVFGAVAAAATHAAGPFAADPTAGPTPVPSGLAYCGEITPARRGAVERAAAVMKSAGEGDALVRLLIAHDVCIGTRDLGYNAGYFGFDEDGEVAQTPGYVIVIDRGTIDELHPDELAAVLVHEAMHGRREFSHTGCYVRGSCTILPNGIELDEEVAAHAAEARWWLALHGPSGTRTGGTWTGTWGSAFENQLLYEYQKGADSFSDFIRSIRSDPREGTGIDGQ